MKKLWCVGLVMVMAVLVASCAAMKPKPKGADLVIQEIKVVPEKIVEGAKFDLQFVVKNVGTDAVGEIKTPSRLLVPRVVVYNGANLFAVSQPIPALKAGEAATLNVEVLNKDTLAGQAGQVTLAKAGEYTLTATLDPRGFIAEVSKDNNQGSVKITVEPKPAEEKK
jgi:hypothetical protein